MSLSLQLDDTSIFHERINSSLNTSSTKQAYSFGKALRFNSNSKSDFSYHFYELPSLQSKRSTSLGYGSKGDYTRHNRGCGSNQLSPPISYFDPKKHNSPAFSFGNEKRLKTIKDFTPGPKYLCRINLQKYVPSFIFGKEGLNNYKSLKKSYSFIGPGSYFNEKNHELSISPTSNLANSANIIIGHEKRFRNFLKDDTPGPGQYNIPGLINKSGIIYNSKYESIPAKSFIGNKDNKVKRGIDFSPGPGQYNYFSIFEGYSRENKVNKKDKKIIYNKE